MHVSSVHDEKPRGAGDNESRTREAPTRGPKAAPRARPWPLLVEGQDPNSLEARVAFHLHRTGCVGARLAASRFLSRPHLQALSQGRLAISAGDIAKLSRQLGLSPRQLLRQLTADEAARWEFYRLSARHRSYVWRRARACWELAGVSARLAAAIMDLRYQNLTQAFDENQSGRVLAYEPASKLASALNIDAGPQAFVLFVTDLLPPEHKVSEVVAPLTNAQLDALKTQHLQAHSRDSGKRR